MEDTTREIELVHVLRHSFRPSETFEAALGAFVKPGLEQPRFLIKSIASLAMRDDRQYSGNIFAARQEIERSKLLDFQIGPKLAVRDLGEGALRLLFQLDDTRNEAGQETNMLNYLAMVNRTSQHLPSAHKERDLEDTKFNFYTVIGPKYAIPMDEIKEPGLALLAGLQSPTTKSMYRVTLDALPVVDERRAILPEYEQPLEQAS